MHRTRADELTRSRLAFRQLAVTQPRHNAMHPRQTTDCDIGQKAGTRHQRPDTLFRKKPPRRVASFIGAPRNSPGVTRWSGLTVALLAGITVIGREGGRADQNG